MDSIVGKQDSGEVAAAMAGGQQQTGSACDAFHADDAAWAALIAADHALLHLDLWHPWQQGIRSGDPTLTVYSFAHRTLTMYSFARTCRWRCQARFALLPQGPQVHPLPAAHTPPSLVHSWCLAA